MKQAWITGSKYFLFWSWNLIFALIVLFLLIDEMLVPIVTGTLVGSVPWDQGAIALLIILVPFASVCIGATKGVRSQPDKLLQLFYGVEMPLFFFVLARLTLLRELTPATTHLLVVFFIGISVFAWRIFRPTLGESNTKVSLFLTGSTLTLLIGLYIGVCLLFFSAPTLKKLVDGLLSEWHLGSLFRHPEALLFIVFFFYTAMVLIALPVVMAYLYCRSFYGHYKIANTKLGKLVSISIVISVIVVNAGVFVVVNDQSQQQVFSMLSHPVASDVQRQALLDQQALIRRGLTNAYLAKYRYSSSTETSNLVSSMYQHAFKLDADGLPQTLQTLFNFVTSPFLYQGNLYGEEERDLAKIKYAEFFDTSIEKRERQMIRDAMKANWKRDGMEAGLINRDEQRVLITQQHVAIEEGEHWGKVIITESYKNQTFDRQEIVYHFSLPEEATIIGVWLSDDMDQPEKYAYTVAPRGAAQKLYKQEVQRRVDPALLEQVGPRQYRLRVFPIPPQRREGRHTIETSAEQLHLRLEYVEPLGNNKIWRLPVLLEKRNVFWNEDTELTINQTPTLHDADDWLPEGVPAQTATPMLSQNLTLKLDDDIYSVSVTPLDLLNAQANDQRYAVLIDTSYSMTQYTDAVTRAVRELISNDSRMIDRVDFYLVGQQSKRQTVTPDFDASQLMYFGSGSYLTQLSQWVATVTGESYSAVILLTDEGSYELSSRREEVVLPSVPIWLVHVDGHLPYAYDDRLLDVITAGDGGVSASLREAIMRHEWKQNQRLSATSRMTEHYLWSFEKQEKGDARVMNGLTQLVARQWIALGYRAHHLAKLDSLDRLHRVAQEYSLVTPFSSMIVLVNDRQKQDLGRLEQLDDRFDRTVENGSEAVQSPMDAFAIPGVPEPEEWALIVVVCVLLMAAYQRRRPRYY